VKLKQDFVTQEIDGTQYLIPVGGEAFSGVVRGNETVAFLVELLKQETTQEALVDAMAAEYDAPREVLAADVARVLDVLREVGALD
jgi:hypothetical protein